MSGGDKDAIIGRATRERSEAKQQVAFLRKEVERAASILKELGIRLDTPERGRQLVADPGLTMRTPLSKQRNKHIQHVLVEAAKLAPRQNHELAVVYEKEKQKGNSNRATLAVARKMVAYLLAVDRGQREFVPSEQHSAAA
jgi:hypothetical protein